MSELLGEARILIRPDTTAFRAQLEEQLAFARKPIVVPIVAARATGAGTASSASLVAQQEASVVAAGRQTAAFRSTAVASAELAGAMSVTAKRTAALTNEQIASAAASARQTAQLERGVASTTLSQFGLRGATLAASGGFIAGAAAATILSKALEASVDATENLRIQTERLRDTVGPLIATNVSAWASGLATNFGLAKDQAIGFVATLEGLFRNFGITAGRATMMSERLVTLAADMAAFKGQGTTTVEALTALQRGLAGNGRALRTFNVFIDQSRVAQEALNETGKTQISSLTRQELVLARYNLILRDTSSQTGAFAQRSNTLAAQEAILQANLRNLAVVAGGPLVTALTDALTRVNDLFVGFEKAKKGAFDLADAMKKIPGGGLFSRLTGPLKDLGLQFLATTDPALGFILHLKNLDDLFNHLFGSSNKAGEGLVTITRDAGDASAAMERLAQATQAANSALLAVTSLEFKQLQIETGLAPGGQQAELANLRQQEAAQKKVVEDTASGSKARREALQKLKNIQDQEKAIERQFASDAKQRAQEAKTEAAKIAQARADATQAFIDAFSGRQQTIQNRITADALTATVRDDLRDNRALLAAFKAELEAIRKRISSMHLQGDALRIAKDAIKTIMQDIFNTRIEIKKLIAEQATNVAEAQAQARADRLTHLEALLSIAETTPGTRDDVRRLRAIEEFDRKRIAELKKKRKLTREEKQELDALRVDLAEREKAIRDLIGVQKKNIVAEQQFAFLQAQQGFVSNLIGNLIPGGLTGLVGGGGGPSVPANVRPTSALTAAQRTSQANLVRGVTSGQAETQTNLLRHILSELHRLNEGRQHPEAHHQRRVGAAIMDTGDSSHGM